MIRPTHPIITELKAIRCSQKVSQDAVGAAMGNDEHSKTINRLETGRQNPMLGTLTRWADALDYELVLRPKAPKLKD